MVASTLFCGFLGLGVSTSKHMPENTLLAVDLQNQVYYAPRFAPAIGTVILRRSDLPKGFRPDPASRDAGEFFNEGRSLTGILLETVGLVPPLKSRWAPDGSWR